MFHRRRPVRVPRPVVSPAAIRQASPEHLAAVFAAPPEEAAPWVEAAAKYGMPRAMVFWGHFLLDGLGGVTQDRAAACEWFRIAATAGEVEGMNMLGRCLENGWGTAVDEAEATRWFRRAAERGFDWGQYNVGNMYLQGRGVPEDRAEALRWYRAAAAQGHAKSINMVARFLEEGWEGPVDPQGAARLYALSAERGDFRGQFNLGALLTAEGRIDEAAHWFRMAAQNAHETFRRGMVERLAARPEPELRAIAGEIRESLALPEPHPPKAQGHWKPLLGAGRRGQDTGEQSSTSAPLMSRT
ncbi:sel1 repeat family protein [Roseomonas eburnea]|uniref:Sel1 repeat family protein n=1 Tax=Neoroseomonas eburnea TaxID=1346889 RepID=A0A9X9X987_9PROT|nr:tetratricopeptide repeat protein [Neoroseomonas eburnea]MBR0680273.1 sel1 repeat family protein [Neoroseomonas eburnea]